MGTLAIWVVNATTTISEPYGHIDYTLNGNENFEAQVITITSGNESITILDRNLWATATGYWADYTRQSYWYYFQRWNNYWFATSGTILSGNALDADIDATLYWPKNPYTGGEFLKTSSSPFDWATTANNNLWWWSGDTTTIAKVTNPEERQWPCPDWWHVPSYSEWKTLIDWIGSSNRETFREKLYIPYAGDRAYNTASPSQGYYAHLWSSSPYGSYSRNLFLNKNTVLMDTNYRANAYSVRCFYDFSSTVSQSFTLSFMGSEWGSISTWSIEAEKWSSISRDDEAGSVSISWTVVATGIANEWYSFSGWMTDCVSGTVTTGCSFTGVFKLETYTITYELNWWTNNENNLTWYTIKDSITFENPTKEWFTFDGWFTDAQFTTWITTIPTWTTWPITVYAKWTENKKSSWSSGWGGRSKTSNDSQISPDPSLSRGEEDSSLIKEGDREAVENLDSNTPMDSSANASEWQNYSQEFQQAYEFAKEKWITTMPTINDANMNWKLTRIAMAKMLSYYAINVLWMKPDETRINKFNDITEKLDAQYDSGVTLAYQLWVMWINMPDNKFRPNDEVTRAEFSTALSRMLYSTPDGKPYYTTHLKKLKAEKILTNDDYKMKELRGYVMIMLMRSAK